MSLFRKPKKTIQRRVFTENDDDDDEPMDVEAQPPQDRDHKKKSKHKPKQPLLSFETEEEGEVFQVKKSSHSKKVMKMFEKERQKKKETKPEKDPKPKVKTEIVTDDLVLVVNHKPAPPLILSGRDALCAGKDDLSDEDEAPTTHKFSKPDNFKKVLESGAIPDAAMIHAARKRRQRAREMGDYIPVEEEEPEDKGRLLREDDNEGSDDERIDMDVNLALRDQERRREQFLAAQESDQEVDEWEHQQIRKGVTGASALASDLLYTDYQPEPTAVAAPVQAMDPGVPRTPQMIADKLREHYQNVCESREANINKLQQNQQDIEQISKELEELKTKAPIAAERFKFYQELRGYITDLVECLDEKVGVIASLEQRAMDQMAKRSEWLIERRRQDVRDQAEEATNKAGMKKVAEDEEKVRRAAEREGRRTRRRRAREIGGQPKHVEGMSSDDEISQQDMLNFDKEREQLDGEIQEVFEDVVEDYSSVANILIKFEEWRETDLAAYNEAYATLCLPKVVSPLVRLDLIFWDPLNDSVDIEKLDWYRTLALYGLHDDESEATLAQDPDINLLPTIVEKIIIPKLTQLVDRCWDPLSSSQTLKLVGIITRYVRKFPTLGPASKALNNLFNAILHKMKCALEHDVFIPLTPKLIESKSPFFQRQFASGLKLLKNITSWQGVLNDNTLKELALNSLLNRYLLSAVKFCLLTDAVSKVSLISLILPRVWLQGNTPELKMFSSSVLNLSQQLDKNNPLHLESIDILNNILKTLRT
ncbi:PAX3- and PAX7-binding protein 1 [Tribolium castaneum]|uniref:PAX3-and PAX7-binding protein 1-like Protein n=1 Tax=Tribolium castaneum TaxID=7070 RepID=D6WKW5_TRICA|nr:PREDICTED: PAX3- and PAX7-binding protein 1 [Tribolium castaneum]EFA04029.1 PAX3- and PAX7-binding protein 1-like Protein [Tribolium castaneum]|eukprot:XP_967900.1 PREDICTED: PAX3- and PAX7-binding protein 1 [Tribolium castaneum]